MQNYMCIRIVRNSSHYGLVLSGYLLMFFQEYAQSQKSKLSACNSSTVQDVSSYIKILHKNTWRFPTQFSMSLDGSVSWIWSAVAARAMRFQARMSLFEDNFLWSNLSHSYSTFIYFLFCKDADYVFILLHYDYSFK